MDNYCIPQEKEQPSFSSILLDSIYNSIDEVDENIFLLHNHQTMKKKKNTSFERVFKVEDWMEKQQLIIEKEFVQLDFERKGLRNDIKSSSSSSTASSTTSGGGFSSSDEKSSGNGVNNYAKEINFFKNERERRDRRAQQGSITRTKAKALKIYRDLKKLKPPISPGGGGGGRVTGFLNSIFIAGNTKKTNISSNYNEIGSERDPKSGNGSNCSSASSYSRSCLIKNPSSRERPTNNGDKRSVRFCPNNVIVDDDNGSTRFKPNAINMEPKVHPMEEKNHHMIESTRELLINIKRNVDKGFDIRIGNQEFRDIDNNEDEENDSSCSSSDLFELNNLFDIGNGFGKYLQELPVYETTSLDSGKF